MSNLTDLLSDDDLLPSSPDEVVPNVHPTITNVPYRLALVGESPGADEIEQGRPFVGYSGQLLNRFLDRFGILRDACFVGNVCQHRPPSNKIAAFEWTGSEIQGGLEKLKHDLSQFGPNVILCLGGTALHAVRHATQQNISRRKSKDGIVFSFPDSISSWRGSFFLGDTNGAAPGVKCIGSFHPAACLRQYEWVPYLMLDLQRAFYESKTKDLSLPLRELKVNLTYHQVLEELDNLLLSEESIGCDIEGNWQVLRSIQFGPTSQCGFAVPFTKMDGSSYWTVDEETEILKRCIRVLSSAKVKKVWQNGLYDRFVFQQQGLIVRGPNEDILLKFWELYCELEKKLAVQASILTMEPYYKEDRESDDLTTFLQYGTRDAVITKEINTKLNRCAFNVDDQMHPKEKHKRTERLRHYRFNEVLLNSLLYMETKGIKYDKEKGHKRLEEIKTHVYRLQHTLNSLTGFGLKGTDKEHLASAVRGTMCYVRDSSIIKKGFEESYKWCQALLQRGGDLSTEELGRLSVELQVELNIEGGKFKPYLYETLALPEQRDPKTKKPTSDYEALQTLLHHCKTDHKSIKGADVALALQVLPIAIELGEARTRMEHIESMHACSSDFSDGRVHSFYNEVGSETGRVTCGKLFKKYGYPLQTVEDENELKPETHPLRTGLRDLLIADNGCYLAKCDLKGADGWTIGANLASLGDRTMLDDLLFGLKPAHFPCFERRHGRGSTNGRSRTELKEMFKEIKKSDWDYFCCKQLCWGFFYLLGLEKASQHVFNTSEGTVYIEPKDAGFFKDVLFRRYNGVLWHSAMQQRLNKQPYPPELSSPSGHTRMFFGRKQEILGQALAHEPQSVTTYATNQAVYKCWTDPENRKEVDSGFRVSSDFQKRSVHCRTILRVEPLHQVHDEFVCQFRKDDVDFAKRKIKEWFNNTIRIAGIDVIVPYDGAYGTNWAMDSTSKVGDL